MSLGRNKFFFLLFLLVISPFAINKIIWLANAKRAIGEMRFIGHDNLGSALGISTYPVIKFKVGKDSFYFNGNFNIDLKKGETVPILYQEKNPTDAVVNTFASVWGETLAYGAGPFLILTVLFFHPLIIPKKSKIVFGSKPFLKIIQPSLS